jgi:hypothetical protein
MHINIGRGSRPAARVAFVMFLGAIDQGGGKRQGGDGVTRAHIWGQEAMGGKEKTPPSRRG